MPEYLAPGVYVEETSFRAKPIAGVSTSTTAFVGLTASGPIDEQPELITSVGDFERIYGGTGNLTVNSAVLPNYLAHAVRGFFENGGRRLYVARVATTGAAAASFALPPTTGDNAIVTQGTFLARAVGSGGNGKITVREVARPAGDATLNAAPPGSLARATVSNTTTYYLKSDAGTWVNAATPATAATPAAGAELVSLSVVTTDVAGITKSYDDLAFGGSHPRFLGTVLAEKPSRRIEQLENRYAFKPANNFTALNLRNLLFNGVVKDDEGVLKVTFVLNNGSDGQSPVIKGFTDALEQLKAIEDISIIAAPGSSTLSIAASVRAALVTHVSRRRAYQIAVLDTDDNLTVSQALTERSTVDTTRAAIYYPWIRVANPDASPTSPGEILVPPSGHICGIYARNDAERGVHKAPANEVVLGALAFETNVNMAQQEVLNASGVNALRFFPGRGLRVWGARTASSDVEWRYVSTRRFFNFIESSIDAGTQWVVFEPNGERLWAKVRDAVSDFLYTQWRDGALLGSSPSEAYFVRCDRSTMSQLDLDEGRLICEIGLAVVKPAEFVIFRVGQTTAGSRN